MNEDAYHVPVMLHEAIDGLKILEGGLYVDCTYGGGGHSAAILERIGKNGRIIAFDQDKDAASNVPQDPRLTFVPNNFRHLSRFLRLHQAIAVNGILADLGVSSHQIDDANRGFSTRFEGLLDMRMDRKMPRTAADVLNKSTEEQLHLMLQNYGEVTNARTLAREMIGYRIAKPFKTLADLNSLLQRVSKGNPRRYYAQVYQAIRIEVNDELNALNDLLEQSAAVLAPGGRIAIITFHSLEDRLVKNFFRYGNKEGVRRTDEFGRNEEIKLRPVSKKPLTPTMAELKINPRSRSAKLRIAEKL